jgi:hypothetical protein
MKEKYRGQNTIIANISEICVLTPFLCALWSITRDEVPERLPAAQGTEKRGAIMKPGSVKIIDHVSAVEPDSSMPNTSNVCLPKSIPIRTTLLLISMLDPLISLRWIIPFTLLALSKPV